MWEVIAQIEEMKGQEEYDLMEDKDSMMKLLEMGFTDLTRNQEALNLN